MSRDLILDVVARKNSRDLTALADEFDRLAKETDDAGVKMNKTTTFSKFLEEELAKTRVKVRELGDEFDRTGSKDVFASLRGAKANLKSLEGISKQLESAVSTGLSEGGTEGSKSVFSALSGVLSTPVLGPVTAGALIAGAVVAAPVVGGIVGGGIAAAMGSGGLFAGALIQAKSNPQVQSAASDLGHWLMSEITVDTTGFAAPLVDAFSLLKTDLKGPVADLGKDFAYLAPYVRDFAMYLGAAAEKVMPGFNRLIQSSGPVLTELGHGLVYAADGLNVMFDEISKGGKGEVEALDFTFRTIGRTLAGVGFAIRGLADIFDGFVQVEKTVVDWTDKWLGSWTLAGPVIRATGIKTELDGISRSFDDGGPAAFDFGADVAGAGAQADVAAHQLQSLSDALDRLFHKHMDADQAALQYKQSILSLSDSIKQNGRHWDDNTAAGQRNWAAVQAGIEAAERKRQADVANGKDAIVAAQEFDDETTRILGMAAAAGAAKGKLSAMAGTYLIDIDEIHREVWSTMTASEFAKNPHGLAHGGFAVPSYATGGIFEVGEQGPEYLSLAPGAGPAYITPNSAINGAANGGQMLGVIEVRVTNAVTGEVIRTELVNVARQRGYRTVDALLPVTSAR